MYKESEFVELKEQLTKEIKKEIVAFANSKGGTIYIGISDNGTIIGLKDASRDIEALSGMIREGIKSDLTLYTQIYIEKINDKDVIVVKVADSPNKPYYLSEKGIKPTGVYLRHGSSSVPASDESIKKMLFDSYNNSFEMQVSFNQDLTFNYLLSLFKDKGVSLNDSNMKTLAMVNNDNLYTNLALLLSDQCSYKIKCAIFNGNDKLEFRDRKEFSGSILKQVNDVFDYLDLFNKTSGKIVGLSRIDSRDYPEYALREALFNAVIHQDYNFNSSVLISLYDNRVEFVSIGGLVKGININDIYMGVSATRNPNLANIFFKLKYVESFGTGINRIITSYKNYNLKPSFDVSDNAFKVVLPNCNYHDDNTFIQDDEIVRYLENNKKVTRSTVEKILGVSKTRANNILNKMIKDGILKKVGIGRTTMYSLK